MSTFSARDLALLLPDKVVGDSYGLRHTDMKDGTEGELLKPKVDASKKVTRYFSGKAPTWAGGESGPTGEEESTVAISIDRTNRRDFKPAVVEDRRLARLAKVSAVTSSETEVVDEDIQPRRRRVYEAQVIVDEEEENFLGADKEQEEEEESKSSSLKLMSVGVGDAMMDDENDIAGRRARVLKRLAEKQAEAAAAAVASASSSSTISGSGRVRASAEEITVGDDEEEEEEEEESEYETDSDDSDDQIIKPVFVPKAKRATLQELAMKEAEEKIKEDKRLLEKEDRKRQTREMVAEVSDPPSLMHFLLKTSQTSLNPLSLALSVTNTNVPTDIKNRVYAGLTSEMSQLRHTPSPFNPSTQSTITPPPFSCSSDITNRVYAGLTREMSQR